jgi:hypothetical protein
MRASSLSRIRLIAATSIAAVALTALPATVAAEDQLVSFWRGCVFEPYNGKTTVAAGQPVIVRWGWGAKTRGLTLIFMKAIDYTVVVNDEATDDYTASEPFRQADGIWRVDWYYAARPLGEGDSVKITLDYSLSHRLTDGGIDPDTGHMAIFGPGSIIYGECTITGKVPTA